MEEGHNPQIASRVRDELLIETTHVSLSPCWQCGSEEGLQVTADLSSSRFLGMERRNNVTFACAACGIIR